MLISDWSSDVCSSDLAMNDQDDPRGPNPEGPNPLIRNLLIWGGVFMALLLAVSMFSSAAQAPGSQIAYSDFRDKVAEGSVAEVRISERSEEHTSELQSLKRISYAVFCLKKKKKKHIRQHI